MVRMNYLRKTMELLKQLYTIHSPFYREWPMICFIREYIREHVPEAEVQMDSWGNLYIKKGKSAGYPTIVCHLDQVQQLQAVFIDEFQQILSLLCRHIIIGVFEHQF